MPPPRTLTYVNEAAPTQGRGGNMARLAGLSICQGRLSVAYARAETTGRRLCRSLRNRQGPLLFGPRPVAHGRPRRPRRQSLDDVAAEVAGLLRRRGQWTLFFAFASLRSTLLSRPRQPRCFVPSDCSFRPRWVWRGYVEQTRGRARGGWVRRIAERLLPQALPEFGCAAPPC